MFDTILSDPRFNAGGAFVNPNFNAEQGGGPTDRDMDYTQAFSGLGRIQAAHKIGPNQYRIIRTKDGANHANTGEEGVVTVNPDGTITQGGWTDYAPDSNTKFYTTALGSLALAAGGLGAMGMFGGAGVGAGAGAGTITGGSGGITPGLASGAGLTASPGTGLTLAGTTGTGAGISGAGGAGWGAGMGAAGGAAGASAALGGSGGAGSITGGSGLTGGTGLGGTGAGLSASPGAGMSLAAPTGTGGGLSVPGFAGAGGGGGLLSSLGSLGSSLGGTGNLLNLGGNLLSGYLGDRAAGKAADAQVKAAQEANALMKYMYDQTRQDNLPALDARNSGLAGYQGLLKDPSSVQNDPGYQFGLSQGTQAIDRSAAARGGLYSGATAKALTRFGNDYGSTKFDNALNRFGNLAGLGQTGTGTIANAAANYGNQAGANLTDMGNARGSAYVGSANSWNNALSGAINGWQQNQLLKQFGFGG